MCFLGTGNHSSLPTGEIPLELDSPDESLRGLGFASYHDSLVGLGSPTAHVWTTSNERFPFLLDSILSKAPRGLYVGVGADRIFEGASRAVNCDGVIALDREVRISKFSRLNALLMTAAETDASKYRSLRGESEPEVWIEKLSGRGVSPDGLRELHRWWVERELDRIPELPDVQGVDNLPYFCHSERFARVASILEDRFAAVCLDLRESQKISEIVAQARRFSPGVAVLDVSNAWRDPFISTEELNRTISSLGPWLVPGAVLIRTVRQPEAPLPSSAESWDEDFVYVATDMVHESGASVVY